MSISFCYRDIKEQPPVAE